MIKFLITEFNEDIVNALINSKFKNIQEIRLDREMLICLSLDDNIWYYQSSGSIKYEKTNKQVLLFLELVNCGIDNQVALHMLEE